MTERLHGTARGTALDGELVALDSEGHPGFNALQNAGPETPVVFFAFDALIHDWKDLKALPLRERISVLPKTFAPSEHAQICESFGGPAASFVKGVRKIGGEGVVAKNLQTSYEAGRRTGAWVKMRLNLGQEFVIGGFTPGSNGFESLLVGFYDGNALIYVAKVKSGFVPASRRQIFARLQTLLTDHCPFANLPETHRGRFGEGLTAAKMAGCIWVRPELVANFEFLEWTDSNHVRHIRFTGLR
jgi:bifunctional non-homologous end joining protein LigD